MTTKESCRIVSGTDAEHLGSYWVEARLITPQGEQVIERIEYKDTELILVVGSIGAALATHWPFASFLARRQLEKQAKKTNEAANLARARLVARLMADGWEPAGAGKGGVVTEMQRERL